MRKSCETFSHCTIVTCIRFVKHSIRWMPSSDHFLSVATNISMHNESLFGWHWIFFFFQAALTLSPLIYAAFNWLGVFPHLFAFILASKHSVAIRLWYLAWFTWFDQNETCHISNGMCITFNILLRFHGVSFRCCPLFISFCRFFLLLSCIQQFSCPVNRKPVLSWYVCIHSNHMRITPNY